MRTFFKPKAKKFRGLCIAAAVAALFATPGLANTERVLSGTVDIDQTRVAFLVSGNAGGGTLHFKGKDYPFTIGGLGIGGIGVSKLNATGWVYNLRDTSAFTGIYSEMRTGHALGDSGKGKLWLENGDGVELELKGKAKGVALSLGADAVHISFK